MQVLQYSIMLFTGCASMRRHEPYTLFQVLAMRSMLPLTLFALAVLVLLSVSSGLEGQRISGRSATVVA